MHGWSRGWSGHGGGRTVTVRPGLVTVRPGACFFPLRFMAESRSSAAQRCAHRHQICTDTTFSDDSPAKSSLECRNLVHESIHVMSQCRGIIGILHFLSPVVSATRLRARRPTPDTYKYVPVNWEGSSKVRCHLVACWGFEALLQYLFMCTSNTFYVHKEDHSS